MYYSLHSHSFTHSSLSVIVYEIVVKALFFKSATISFKWSQWSVVLTWTELCINPTNKSNPGSNISICCHQKPKCVLTQLQLANTTCLAFVATAASLLWWKKWCLTFHTWCLTCLREREYFFLYHDVIPFMLLIFCFSPLSPPGPLLCPASGPYKTWCYCFCLPCVYTFPPWSLKNCMCKRTTTFLFS